MPGRSWCASSAASTIGATAPRNCPRRAGATASRSPIPGDGRPDARLAALSTVPAEALGAARALLARGRRRQRHRPRCAIIARLGGLERGAAAEPVALPMASRAGATCRRRHAPRAAIVFYRSILLADDTAPIDALCRRLEARGLGATAIFVTASRTEEAAAFVERSLAICALPSSSTRRRSRRSATTARPARRGRMPDPAGRHRRRVARRRGTPRRGASRHPTSQCMSLCRSSTGGSWPAPSPSRPRASEGDPRVEHRQRAASSRRRKSRSARLAAPRRAALGAISRRTPAGPTAGSRSCSLDYPAERRHAPGYAVRARHAGERAPISLARRGRGLRFDRYRKARPTSQPARAAPAAWGDPRADPACDGEALGAGVACGNVPRRRAARSRLARSTARPTAARRTCRRRHAYLAFYLWLRDVATPTR